MAGELALEPRLGGVVRGRVLSEPGHSRFRAFLAFLFAVGESPLAWEPIRADGRFELRRISAGRELELELRELTAPEDAQRARLPSTASAARNAAAAVEGSARHRSPVVLRRGRSYEPLAMRRRGRRP